MMKMVASMVRMPKLHLSLLLLGLCSMLIPTSADWSGAQQWCIADGQTPDEVLQGALDWACGEGGGVDCSLIQENQPCFLPNTLRDHASFAFNSYWQKTKNDGGSCYFNAAAFVTEEDPSHDSCKFEYVQ